ncbi:hypothetical protein FRC05_001817 [Tulasnella sp. 425]|nr:hypothetical protein FRC05_001817 [Tulasnella sp. 425]
MAPSRNSRDNDDDDPLWLAIKPPPDETPKQAALREKRETEAKLISDKIDEQIRQESALLQKQKVIRLLLLGQAESGKSTTLKQFQILHSTNALQSERLSWRLVIHLNLVKSIRRILEAVTNAQSALDSPMTKRSIVPSDDRWDTSASGIACPRMSVDSFQSTLTASTPDTSDFTDFKLRLMPLLRAEEILATKLASPDSLYYRGDALGGREGYNRLSWTDSAGNGKEMYVRSGDMWKLETGVVSDIGDPDIDEAANLIFKARDDMMRLWVSPAVRGILEREKINLSESSGFFLDDMDRITRRDYVPTNDDILNARLMTAGIVEHSFQINTGGDKAVEWRIYDVGGSRSQRAAWPPFFDNVQAIIFLAPVSVFDQVLAEDPSVNRLEDSLRLWRELCKNTILSKVPLVLFLTKCDLLRQKLLSGVRLSKYMSSYGDRPNDYDSILKYFKNKFDAIRRQYSKDPEREFYVFATSVTDTHQAGSIVTSVTRRENKQKWVYGAKGYWEVVGVLRVFGRRFLDKGLGYPTVGMFWLQTAQVQALYTTVEDLPKQREYSANFAADPALDELRTIVEDALKPLTAQITALDTSLTKLDTNLTAQITALDTNLTKLGGQVTGLQRSFGTWAIQQAQYFNSQRAEGTGFQPVPFPDASWPEGEDYPPLDSIQAIRNLDRQALLKYTSRYEIRRDRRRPEGDDELRRMLLSHLGVSAIAEQMGLLA